MQGGFWTTKGLDTRGRKQCANHDGGRTIERVRLWSLGLEAGRRLIMVKWHPFSVLLSQSYFLAPLNDLGLAGAP